MILKLIAMYGTKRRSLTKKTTSRVQASGMKVLRATRGVTGLDRLRIEQVRTDFSVKLILRDI